jgi:hypothetical protein
LYIFAKTLKIAKPEILCNNDLRKCFPKYLFGAVTIHKMLNYFTTIGQSV